MTWKALFALLASALLLAAPAWGEEMAADAAEAGSVVRLSFTTAVVAREPQDDIDQLTNDRSQIFFFTELHNMEGETVTHRWEFNGKVMAEVDFEVGSPRWRTYSSKNLQPIWIGDWTVTVVDSEEHVLATEVLTYTKAQLDAVPASME